MVWLLERALPGKQRMTQPSTLAATVAALRLLERSLDHSFWDRWERCHAYLSNEKRSEQLLRILDSWAGGCETLVLKRQRFRGLRRIGSRWVSGTGQVELIPLNVAKQALETLRSALMLGAEPERPTNEDLVRVRMALSRSQAELCRLSGARGLSRWAGSVENFNAAYHLKVVPLNAFMERNRHA